MPKRRRTRGHSSLGGDVMRGIDPALIIIARHENPGRTLRELADPLGLSRERVRQVLDKAGVRTRAEPSRAGAPHGARISIPCQNPGCSKTREVLPYEVKRAKYCGRRCSDAALKSARDGKTHCPRGHLYTPDTRAFYTNAAGYMVRHCKTCDIASASRWQRENPERQRENNRRYMRRKAAMG